MTHFEHGLRLRAGLSKLSLSLVFNNFQLLLVNIGTYECCECFQLILLSFYFVLFITLVHFFSYVI